MELDVVSEREPTVLEFARFHGLCTDFTLEQPPLRNNQFLSDETFDSDLQDLPDDPIPTNSAYELTKERLAISKETVYLLRSIKLLVGPLDDSLLTLDGTKRVRGLKQEIPLVRTDHELDMLSFGSTITLNLDKLKIPLELVDEEKDEGMEWPSKYSACSSQCYEQARSEKLAISRDIFFYLQDTIKDHFEPLDAEELRAATLTYRRVRHSHAVSYQLTAIEHSNAASDPALASCNTSNNALHSIISCKSP
jgi:hypothetical protein